MPDFGPAELAIILLVVVLIFGSQRLGDLGGSLGKGIRDFRRELKDDSPDVDEVATAAARQAETPVATATMAETPAADAVGLLCANCDTENAPTAVFCSECGKPLAVSPA